MHSSRDGRPDRPDDGRWRIFAVCVAAAILTVLDLSKVNVGLPSIEHSLDADAAALQLIVAAYALAYGLALVPAGRLGDIHSRKLMFVIGLAAFTATSIFCALASDAQMLVLARVLQGFAGGLLPPQVLGIIQHQFQGTERGKALGIFGAMTGIATAAGPALGGLLVEVGTPTDGWRLLFWMNVPVGAVAILLALRLLPRSDRLQRLPVSLDITGITLLAISTLALMLPLVQTTGASSDNPWRWMWLGLAAIAGVAFVLWERHYKSAGRSPAVDLELFRSTGFRNGLLVATSYLAVLPAVFLLAMLYLQDGLGLTALWAGIVAVPFAASATVTAWVSGRLVAAYGRAVVVFGLCVVGVGFVSSIVAVSFLPTDTIPWGLGATLFISGIGSGLVIAPNLTLTLSDVPINQAGVAGSVTQVGQRIGNAVGVALATSIYFAILHDARSSDREQRYDDAFVGALMVAIAGLCTALCVAIVDLRQRRGDPQE
ncbi:MFS transporter [Microbacterium aerolatum]|uniref:MFS transporter n=1 Tax=Microbacterium aerolatum TaxID=153731 RepID=UPI0011BDAD22|nr:MFS transporter [Microbacterium aerolatum]